jgi:tetratricopeptide (TPR) repeat protein
MGNLRATGGGGAPATRRTRTRKRTPQVRAAVLHLGRVLAVLRTTLDFTQSELARLSRVKRSSISKFERGLLTPDSTTLERLLSAMRFRWSAIDLGAWFIERLRADCQSPEGTTEETAPLSLAAREAEKLSVQAAEMSRTATKLKHLARTLQSGEEEEASAAETPSLDRAAARDLWTRLRPLPREEQENHLGHVPARLQWAICEKLCLESQRLCADDPIRGRFVAELALFAADRADGSDAWRARLRALAWAHIGNAVRVQGDLFGAESAFALADRLWQEGEDVQGLLEEGLIVALKASLRRAQRRFDEAAELLERALSLARSPRFRVEVLVNKARLLSDLGDLPQAVEILRGLSESVQPDDEGRVVLWIKQNLADSLSRLGNWEEAAALLPEARSLCVRYGGGLNLFRVLWIEGRVALGQGDVSGGIARLARVRGEFAARNMGYDTALASLELAASYAQEGRADQVKTLARHMAPIFQAHEVHREALAVLSLFRQAAERERVTEGFAREVLLYLWKARYNPELRFEGRALD